MMKYFLTISFIVAYVAAMPVDIAEDEDGQQYVLVPVSRERRQTKYGVSDQGLMLSHTGDIFKDDISQVSGTAYAARSWNSNGLRPDAYGGELSYKNDPSRTSIFTSADHVRGMGTDVNAGAKYNIYSNKDLTVDLAGQYGRHYGGPGGTGDPQAGVFLTAKGTF